MWDLLGIRVSLHTLFCLSLNVSTYDLEICLKKEIKVVLFFSLTRWKPFITSSRAPSSFWCFNSNGPLWVAYSFSVLYSLHIEIAVHP